MAIEIMDWDQQARSPGQAPPALAVALRYVKAGDLRADLGAQLFDNALGERPGLATDVTPAHGFAPHTGSRQSASMLRPYTRAPARSVPATGHAAAGPRGRLACDKKATSGIPHMRHTAPRRNTTHGPG